MVTDQSPDAWRRRVEALFAKAESTRFGPEAETLIAKAHELMVRHSIDEAILARRIASGDIGTQLLVVRDPYAGAKTSLLGAVARANGCRVVINGGGRGPQSCTLVGHSTDRHNTTAMFAWLVLYAGEAMRAAVVPPWDTARRFRHAFLLGFAGRIGERLQTATDAAKEAVAGPSTAIVVQARRKAVDAFMESEFPLLARGRRTATSTAGAASGREAADRAGLSRSIQVPRAAELPTAR